MSWTMLPFEDLYQLPSRNGITRPSKVRGVGFRMINMGELFANDRIGDIEMELVQLNEKELDTMLVNPGDLLFARQSLVLSGAGKCSIVVDAKEPTTFESHLIRVRLKAGVTDPRFYHYYFKSPASPMRSIVTQGVQAGIRANDLKRLIVPCPPLSEQECIADILSAYDDLIENNRRRIALLEQSARLLYREWFVHLRFPGHEHVKVVDGVPEGWRKERLTDLAEITMGQSPTSDHYNKDRIGFPFHQGVTGFGERFVEHETWCDVRGRMAMPMDILFSVRAPVGRLNVTPDEIVIGRGLSALRSKHDLQSMLFYQLANHFFKEDMIGGGAIFASVTKKELEGQLMLMPSLNLACEFNEVASSIDRQIGVLVEQNRKLREARDLLLPRLMSGDLVV